MSDRCLEGVALTRLDGSKQISNRADAHSSPKVPISLVFARQSVEHRLGKDFVDDVSPFNEHAVDRLRGRVPKHKTIRADTQTTVVLQGAFQWFHVPFLGSKVSQGTP